MILFTTFFLHPLFYIKSIIANFVPWTAAKSKQETKKNDRWLNQLDSNHDSVTLSTNA